MAQIIAVVSLALSGAFILSLSAIKFHGMFRMIRKSSYRLTPKTIRRQILQECLTFLFAGSYLVGAVQALTNELDFLLIFEAMLFFACAVFFYIMISEQLDMEKELNERNIEILRTFVNAIDRKDSYTRGHSQHVYEVVKLIYEQLPATVCKSISLPKLLDAALLHDIGKIAVDDKILKKQGTLTEDEWLLMKSHAREGKRLIDDTCLNEIADWVLYHHERIDGNGYEGLHGGKIPIESRIIAIADTFSALTTNREYRNAMSIEKAIQVMKGVESTQLDGNLLEYFFRIPREQLVRID